MSWLCLQLVNSAALLLFLRFACVENDAVAWLERAAEAYPNAVFLNGQNLAEIDAALFAESGVNEFLIVNTFEPAGVKATGKGHFQIVGCGRSVVGDGLEARCNGRR